jgi:hypothetical protein
MHEIVESAERRDDINAGIAYMLNQKRAAASAHQANKERRIREAARETIFPAGDY